MAVLTKERLEGYGPFVDFLERRPGEEPGLILSVSDDLLHLCCGVTNCYLPFDPHLTVELSDQSIRLLARECLLWAAHLAHCRLDDNDIGILMPLYLPEDSVGRPARKAAAEALREDLIDTWTFLATELLAVARAGHRLAIVGF